MQSCSQGFTDGLFGCETPCQAGNFATSLQNLVLGEDAAKEAFAVSCKYFTDPLYFASLPQFFFVF
jgi:hypothetical protein